MIVHTNTQELIWKVYDDKERPVCNFVPEVKKVIEVQFEDGIKKIVQLELLFSNDVKYEVSLELNCLEKIKWSDLCEFCVVNFQNRNAKLYLSTLIRSRLMQASYETWFGVKRTGIHKFNDMVLYCAGKDVITTNNKDGANNRVWIDNIPFSLDIEQNITLSDALTGVMELISLVPEVGSVLLAQAIGGIMSEAYRQVGFNPCTIIEVVGKSGMLKSTYVPQLVQLFNRNEEVTAATRFNATNRFMENLISSYSDCTVLIDDLHTAQVSELKRKNENVAETIVREISDNKGRGYTNGDTQKQKEFRANVVFIGEYIIGQESSTPRLLVVEMQKRPDGAILDKYQRKNKLYVPTFYYHFIRWYVENFHELVEEIDVKLTSRRKNKTDCELHGRLGDSKFYLEMSFKFFLNFCEEQNLMEIQEVNKLYEGFKDVLNQHIKDQQARYEYENKMEILVLDLIWNLYKKKLIEVVKNVNKFDLSKHQGLIYYDCLCIRRDVLLDIIKKYLPNVSVNKIIRTLRDKGLLKLWDDKNTVKIAPLQKKYGSIRFYAIWLHAFEHN